MLYQTHYCLGKQKMKITCSLLFEDTIDFMNKQQSLKKQRRFMITIVIIELNILLNYIVVKYNNWD